MRFSDVHCSTKKHLDIDESLFLYVIWQHTRSEYDFVMYTKISLSRPPLGLSESNLNN